MSILVQVAMEIALWALNLGGIRVAVGESKSGQASIILMAMTKLISKVEAMVWKWV